MKLQIGERLSGSGPPGQPGGYVVTEILSETPWSGLYAARKVCYNFDFTAKRPRETDEKEWLDVLLRTVNYPHLDSAEYVAGRRALARAECRTVLGNRTSNLWPEPLDLLELANTRDPFTFAREAPEALAREPVVVLARPHGETVTRWLHSDPPLALVLSVVAELLEFVADAHRDGLLLNGLGPSALLVDRAGRMHYLGTDMAVQLEGSAGAAGDWKQFFPPERYARGYSAPECFDPRAPRDRRTDLYAWAATAYFLLTGDRPVQRAFEQGQPWARFGNEQFARLDKTLAAMPPAQVEHWAEQLLVEPEALRRDWPRNFVAALRFVLSPDPGLRPYSAAELRTWLVAPPPAPPRAVLAVRLPRSDAVRLFVAVPEPGLEIVIRRGAGVTPQRPEQGEPVYDGPPKSAIEDTWPRTPCPGGDDGFLNPASDAARYAAFTRRRYGSTATCSAPTPAHLLDPFPPNLRRLAEGNGQPGAADEPEPPLVGLLFEALDTTRAAEALLASPLPQVRGWALRRAAAARGKPGAAGSVEVLLLRALNEPLAPLRMEALRGLLSGAEPSDVLLRRVFGALAAAHPEDCVAADRMAQEAKVREEQLRPILAALKLDIPTVCPVCAASLADRDTRGHLVRAHGYVEIAGEAKPRAEALAWLWDRVFQAGDAAAHDRLFELLQGSGSARAGAAEVSPYITALQDEIGRQAPTALDDPQSLARLVTCLRQNPAARPLFPQLLRSPDARVRGLGRELVLPDLVERLAGKPPSAAEVRTCLDEISAADQTEEKLLLCERLAPLGVAGEAVEACVRRLQGERPVVCKECGKAVHQADYETHLRRAHRVYEFRGKRGSQQQTVKALLEALCGNRPDFDAWGTLREVAREEHGDNADVMLGSWLTRRVHAIAEAKRGPVAAAAAEAIAAGEGGASLVPVLVSSATVAALQPAPWLLALEVTTRLPAPLGADVLKAVKPLLADRRLAREVREAAVAALLRTTGKSGPAALEILSAYTGPASKPKAIELLRQLEQRLGQAEAIDELCAQLESLTRMACPRCQVELTRLDMIGHLWDEHRLVLEGRRVREPWHIIQGWVDDYRLETDPAVLERCRTLATRTDAEHGLAQLQRLLLQRGVDDPAVRDALRAEAGERGASLCPHCYAEVPLPEYPPPPELHFGKQGLSGGGYRVEVKDSGLAPRLEVRVPGGPLYRGREPGSRLTRLGALVLLAAPLLLAAGALAFLPQLGALPRWLPAAVAGGLGLLAGLGVLVLWPKPGDVRARALHHAWAILVPYLQRKGFPAGSVELLAGLAELSTGRDEDVRARCLPEARAVVEQAAAADPAQGVNAGTAARLAIEDATREGEDLVPALAASLLRCVQGELPLGFAAGLLRERDGAGWSDEDRQRVRALLCERAAEAGLALQDLLDAGRACEQLGALLRVDDEAALKALIPQGMAAQGRTPEVSRRLVERNGVPCPECKRVVLACRGEIGMAAEQSVEESPAAQPA